MVWLLVSRGRFGPDGGVPVRAAVQGVRRAHQPDRADVSDGHRRSACACTVRRPCSPGACCFVGQLLYVVGDVYTYSYPALLGGAVGFPSAGRRDLPPRLSGALRRAVVARAAAQPERRSRRRHRLADPDGRLCAAVVGVPRRAEHPSLGPVAAREARLGRLSARRHPPARRADQARRRRGQENDVLLSARREHRCAARNGLRVQLRAARRGRTTIS